MARTSYALKTFGSSTDGMLTATPLCPTAPRRTLRQGRLGAPSNSELRGLAVGRVGPRGGEIADRGLLAGTQPDEAPETGAERRRCQTAASQFAGIFVRSRTAFVGSRAFSQFAALRPVGA